MLHQLSLIDISVFCYSNKGGIMRLILSVCLSVCMSMSVCPCDISKSCLDGSVWSFPGWQRILSFFFYSIFRWSMRRQSSRISAFPQADGQGLPPLLGLPNGRFQSGQHDSIRGWKMRFFNVVRELHCCEGSNVQACIMWLLVHRNNIGRMPFLTPTSD